jgi:DNA-binding response OmpR family regulator
MMAKEVLVVDDNQDAVNILVRVLEKNGYAVLVARSGEEAIRMTRSEDPGLILLDIMMPGIDGFEVCQAVKSSSKTKHIPIVMVTGKTDFESRFRALRLGAADYLRKPIHPVETVMKVKAYLKQSAGG